MAKVLIYNNDENKMETFERKETDAMPYITGRSMTVGEFRGSSKSNVLWSDKTTMETWTAFRRYYGDPIFIGYAFKRIWEGGHGKQSQHYAGVSFDTGQNLSTSGRNRLHSAAVSFGRWTYVEPKSLTPTWVHFDKRYGTPACSSGGYPVRRKGDKGIYVLVLQDALNALGFSTRTLDGIFGDWTLNAVRQFQTDSGLTSDGIVGCGTWRSLTDKAVKIGRTIYLFV